MEPRIQKLTIENFRLFRHLELDDIGRCNLLTGKNNTGKSSVLEALRLLASNGAMDVINDVLEGREERTTEAGGNAVASFWDESFPWSGMFHGFPASPDDTARIVIDASPYRVEFQPSAWSTDKADHDGADGDAPSPAVIIVAGDQKHIVPMRSVRRNHHPHPAPRSRDGKPELHAVYLGPIAGSNSSALSDLWDDMVIEGHQECVVRALQVIDPGIDAINMIGGNGRRRIRTAIVRSKTFDRPVPLRSYGDGVNRLFGIILSLVNAKGGLLLIDEFENGLHYSVQETIWRAIFRLANELDVQVFATSHSWDAIKAFQAAAKDSPGDGVLIRLTRKGEDIIPTVLDEKDLSIATESGIEVR